MDSLQLNSVKRKHEGYKLQMDLSFLERISLISRELSLEYQIKWIHYEEYCSGKESRLEGSHNDM